jgi:uncharacterized protein (DUF2461 family)
VSGDKRGAQLDRITNQLTKAGWELGSVQLKTVPRGYDVTHRRIGLLRHKSLYAGRPDGFDEIIHTPMLLDQVRAHWQALRPLVGWLARTVD